MIKRARHGCSQGLKAAAREYYSQMGQDKITSMRLIEYKYGHSILDDVLVRIKDEKGNRLTTICSYDGYQGKLRHPERPNVTEIEYCNREVEDEYVNAYMNEPETDLEADDMYEEE